MIGSQVERKTPKVRGCEGIGAVWEREKGRRTKRKHECVGSVVQADLVTGPVEYGKVCALGVSGRERAN